MFSMRRQWFQTAIGSFEHWRDAHESPRTILEISDSDYYCVPQVFFFAPRKTWYLVYQMGARCPEDVGGILNHANH